MLQRFTYDFDGTTLEVVKFHPWKTEDCFVKTGDPNTDETHYHCEQMSASFDTLDALLISWIAHRRLGLNQHALVAGVCRALGVYPRESAQA